MEKIAGMKPVSISLSVVSHGQMDLIALLMHDIQTYCGGLRIELILTLNIEEALTIDESVFSYPVKFIRNTTPKGFGANHNQAFKLALGDYFCIVNPDIRLDSNPFEGLINGLESLHAGVVAPLVFGPEGKIEDSARRFPTPGKILDKALGKPCGPDYVVQKECILVDWVGGMFMLFPCPVFQELNGFDENYFLYYEDVDICARMSLAGFLVALCPDSRVVHHAQRNSHRNMKYLRWHLTSMLRFFTSPVYRQLRRLRRL
jgi:GT2 family glycosyltransferase